MSVRPGTPTTAPATPTTEDSINVFIYQVDTGVEGRLIRYGEIQVPGTSEQPEMDGWLGYIRKNGTPPVGHYVIFSGGHQYQVVTTQTLAVNDLGTAT